MYPTEQNSLPSASLIVFVEPERRSFNSFTLANKIKESVEPESMSARTENFLLMVFGQNMDFMLLRLHKKQEDWHAVTR